MSIVRWFVIGCVLGQLSACKRSGEASAPEQAPAATAAAAEKPSRAAEEVKPAELDPADAMVAEGAALYARMCAVCHGESGEGYKADQAPALRQQDFLAAVSDDFLGMSIADGRKGTSMSAWFIERGGPLSERDIAALILFLRSWQTKPPISLDQRPVHGDEQRGKTLFEQHCASCHGPQGKYVRILGRQFLSLASNGYLRQVLRDGRPSAPAPMPSFASTLGTSGIEDIVAHMRTFPAWPTPPEPSAPPPPIPLGRVPLNPRGPAPVGFNKYPKHTAVDVVSAALAKGSRMLLLDARAPTDYKELHIAGAVSVPFYDPAPYLAKLPKDSWLVAYCACPHAESGALSQKLVDAGFSLVTILDEGLNVWIDRGYPTRSGLEP